MATLNYDSLIPYITLDVAGAPEPVIVAMTNMAARELCKKSGCWNEYEDIVIRAGKSDYETSAPNGAQISFVKLIRIEAANREITPTSEEILAYYKRIGAGAVGAPLFYHMLNDMSFRLLPQPADTDDGQIMRVRTVYVPKLGSTVFDAMLIERFAETLIAGAKWKLMEMPNKPWSNPGLAAYNKGVFDEGVTKARIEVELSNTPAQMTIRKRRFGST